MFFFRHPKPATDRKEVAVLVQQNKAATVGQEQVLIARETSVTRDDERGEDPIQPMQKGDDTPPPA